MTKQEVKLKTAAEEIKEILRKHDISASIVLHAAGENGNGYGEYVNHIHTSYSCAYWYNDNEVRFHSKRKEYDSDQQQIEKLTNTSNMLSILAQGIGNNFIMFDALNQKFDSLVGAEHGKTTWK